MAGFSSRLAGAGYVVLNVIRVLNIISLLAVVAASAIILVKTLNNNTFFFFDASDHVIRAVMCGFLILSELPLFKQYWMRKWPLFSQQSGFVMLGVSMLGIGNNVLANLNKQTASQDKLGLPFWRLVIGSGIVIMVMGVVNIIASYIFRDTTKDLTARQVRSDGATASHKADVASTVAASTPKQKRHSRYRSFFLNADQQQRNSLPSYHAASDIRRSNTAMTQRDRQGYGSSHRQNRMQSPGKQAPASPSSSSSYSYDSPRQPEVAHPAYR